MRTIQRLQQTLLIIVVGLVTCPANIQAQKDWTPHVGNPVLAPGAAGNWDSGAVLAPTVIQSADTLKMWYAGSTRSGPPANFGIGYATSTDGITWTKHDANPVMTGREGEWDEPGVHSPIVMVDGDTLHMWYAGGNNPDRTDIGYATSVDGINWDRYPTPVMEFGEPDTWNEVWMAPGTVLKEDGVFKMWFFGGVGGLLGPHAQIKTGVGYATSPDGITWTLYDDPATTDPPYQFSDPVMNHGAAGAWDSNLLANPNVRRTEDGYEMWYSGVRHLGQQYMGYATSPDGIMWTKDAGNPHTWASPFGFPSVMLDTEADEYRMWYWLGSRVEIGYATAPVKGLGTGLETVGIPDGFELHQNHPNPFMGRTAITYELPEASEVTLTLLDAIGRPIRVLDDGPKSAGMHTIALDPSGMVSGVYFYRLDAGRVQTTRSMVILK